ncbi:FxsA family protein [Azospirillum halopraeferens]|uniref:FxsA family protein n=1 Tax=Azospirillum halopraeferens TaxID=34010 RepID=UPI00041F7804|nr:FxsA family protein [Azospirillum halopraeferens]
MNPLLLLLLLPLVEIALFIQVGSWIGVLATIGLIALSAVAGTVLLRLQGLSVLRRAQASADRGELPVGAVLHGFCMVVAAILLIIPGFLSDAVGLLLFIAPVRAGMGRWLLERMGARTRVWTSGRPGDAGSARPGDAGAPPPGGRVIDVDYEEVQPRTTDGAPRRDDGDAPRLEESRWRPEGREPGGRP